MFNNSIIAAVLGVTLTWVANVDAQSCQRCQCPPPCKIPGLHGRPHVDRELGGCCCGKKTSLAHGFSVHWPKPLTACKFINSKENYPHDCPSPKLRDRLDVLADFKLFNNARCDNGYSGPDCDPYGCLGESYYKDE